MTEKALVAQTNLKVIIEFLKDNDIRPEKVSKASGLDGSIKLWAGTQMRYILSGVLSDEEVDVYLDYNFNFGVKPLKWNEWFHMVETYCKDNCTETIPKGTRSKEGYALDIWFNRQIKNIKKLPPEKVEMIRSIKPEKPNNSKDAAFPLKDYLIKYRGKKYHLCLDFSKETNIPLYIVYDAVKRGVSDGDVIVSEYEEKYLRTKEEKPITYEGKTFANVKEFSDHYRIDVNMASVLFDSGDDPKRVVNYCRYVQREIKNIDNYSDSLERKDIAIEYEGQHFSSLKQFSDEFGLNYSKAVYYFSMDNTPAEIIQYSKEEINNIPKRAIEYKGKVYKTKRQFAEMQGIPYQRLISLLNKGFTVEQIVEFHEDGYTKRPHHGTEIQYDGNRFISIKAFADYYNLDYQYVFLRYRSGWTCDEILHPEQYETQNKSVYYKEAIPCAEEVEKWENSSDERDTYRAAKAYFSGVGVNKDLEKAFQLLYRIKHYTQAKYILAQCYLYGKGTSQDIKQAIKLLKEYDEEKQGESSPHFRDKESGLLKRVLPFLLEAYHLDLLLNNDVGSLEQLIYFATVLNNPEVQLWLYEYYSDKENIYYDLGEAKKYKELRGLWND